MLEVDWTYSEAVHREETVRRVATDYVEALKEMAVQVRAYPRGACPPSLACSWPPGLRFLRPGLPSNPRCGA